MSINSIFDHLKQTIFSQDNLQAKPIGGGSINQAYGIATKGRNFFLKVNDAQKYPNLFEKEASGLSLLNQYSQFTIPEVIEFGQIKNTQYLLLSYLIELPNSEASSRNFGNLLAQMHQQSTTFFGLNHDNYIGSLHQSNKQSENWTDFFVNERITPLLKLSYNKGQLNRQSLKRFEHFFYRFPDLIPAENPALLHGDLWSGNVMNTTFGPSIFDPAVYFGHREMDIAMMHLFGGFDKSVFESYLSQFPMEPGWENRIKYHNLYPLLVHLVLFGLAYRNDVLEVVNDF